MRRQSLSVEALVISLVMCGGIARAEGPPPVPAPATRAPDMVTKVFSVAELVCLAPDFKISDQKSHASSVPHVEVCGDRLVSQITSMIAPGTWECEGGPGRIEFYEKSLSLVVCHTADTVEQIGAALQRLKKRHETTVVFEMKLLRLPPESADSTMEKCDTILTINGPGSLVGLLTGEQAALLLTRITGETAGRVAHLPRLSVLHGQTASMMVGEEKPVVHNRIYTLAGGVGYDIPEKVIPKMCGVGVTVCPIVSADGK